MIAKWSEATSNMRQKGNLSSAIYSVRFISLWLAEQRGLCYADYLLYITCTSITKYAHTVTMVSCSLKDRLPFSLAFTGKV